MNAPVELAEMLVAKTASDQQKALKKRAARLPMRLETWSGFQVETP